MREAIFCMSIHPRTVWFRLFGWGLHATTTKPLFSERHGYTKKLRIFGVGFEILKPAARELEEQREELEQSKLFDLPKEEPRERWHILTYVEGERGVFSMELTDRELELCKLFAALSAGYRIRQNLGYSFLECVGDDCPWCDEHTAWHYFDYQAKEKLECTGRKKST